MAGRKKKQTEDVNPWEDSSRSKSLGTEPSQTPKQKYKKESNEKPLLDFDRILKVFRRTKEKNNQNKEQDKTTEKGNKPVYSYRQELISSADINSINAIVFVVFAIAGSLLLILFKSLAGSGTFGIIISIFMPLFILLAYAIFSSNYRGLSSRKDQIGDNLYYLGFIFTLSALAFSIINIEDANAVLSNFGLAIWSTLWGIVLRTGYNQLRFDPDDVEEASRLELSEASRRVRVELDETIRQLADFRRASQQMINEGFSETKENIDAISGEILKSVIKASEGSTKPIEKMAEASAKATEKLSKQIDEFAYNTEKFNARQEKLLQATLGISDAMSKFANEYKSQDTIGSSIRRGLQETLTETIKKQDEKISQRDAQTQAAFESLLKRAATIKKRTAAATKQDKSDLSENTPLEKDKKGFLWRFFIGD